MANDERDDEPLVLSSSALDALKEFYAERDAHTQRFAGLQAEAEEKKNSAAATAAADSPAGEAGARRLEPLSMQLFSEDWNKSQFWYSDETATLLARQLLDGATSETTIAVVSAPSVFIALKNILTSSPPSNDHPQPKLVLLEHDDRFTVFPEYLFYDFMQPTKLPAQLKGSVDRIICDPPFLSEDCQTKAAMTIRWLLKPAASRESEDEGGAARRLIVCTGERMEDLVTRLYMSVGLRTTTYEPAHARGLSNEFYCYANFLCQDWTWRQASS